MPSPQQDNALWIFDDQRWSQQPDTGAFDLVDFKGLGAPAKAYDSQDIAELVGARISLDAADRGGRPALYPGPFGFSPITGKALPAPPAPDRSLWLPPSGGDGGSVLGKPGGLRLTTASLSLRASLTIDSPPDAELRLPPPGNYQFLVGAFTTGAARLLALERSTGLIYSWLPRASTWVELVTGGEEILSGTSLSEHAWGMAAPDLLDSTRIFLPTDQGLGVVSINLIALKYHTRFAGDRCMGAPVLQHGKIFVPMQGGDRRLGVYVLDPGQPDGLRRLAGSAVDVDATEWVRPIADRRHIIWMSAAGQLLVRQTGVAAAEVSFVPWGAGVVPRFDLGSAYVSGDGHLWQQCFRETASGGQFVFVQLGRTGPEIHPTSSPRLSTGSTSFQLETLLRANPWTDPEEGMDAAADEIVIPLLESPSSATIVCARVPSTSAVDSVFTSGDPCRATFTLRGDHEVRFLVARLARPWITRPFVFAGHLYLYHPDLPRIPGWRLS